MANKSQSFQTPISHLERPAAAVSAAGHPGEKSRTRCKYASTLTPRHYILRFTNNLVKLHKYIVIFPSNWYNYFCVYRRLSLYVWYYAYHPCPALLAQLRAVHRYVLGFLSNYSNTFTNSLQVPVHNVPVETSSGVTFQRSPVKITACAHLKLPAIMLICSGSITVPTHDESAGKTS